MGLNLQFLGTGTSVGVPQIGCTCPVCTSSDPRDRRRRTSLYVQSPKVSFLVDTSPELREACLAYGISRVEAVVITHAHMDHIAGFDDVRRFNTLNGGAPMRCYGSPATLAALQRVFPYITDKANAQGLFRPMIVFTPFDGPFDLGDVQVTPLEVVHGPPTNGYVFACGGVRVGYISDCHEIPDAALAQLAGVDLMVLNCLRRRAHPTHLDLDTARAYLARIAPRRARLVHMCHDLSHQDYLEALADTPWITPAYDGEIVDVQPSENNTP